MRGIASVVIALAACQDGGLVIIVDPQPGMHVDQVRLYLGHGERTDTPSLVTDHGGAVNVSYWARDVGNELDIASPDMVDGSVGFTLVRTDSDNLPVVIAVGFANGKPVGEAAKFDLPIPNNEFHAYHLALHGPVSTLDQPSQHGLALWSPPATASNDLTRQACAGAVIAVPDVAGVRAFVVDPDDQDCDGFRTGDPKECDPNYYMANRPAIANEIDCLVNVPGNPPECMFGGPHCVDGVGHMGTCMPTNYCAPLELCACADLKCATDPARGGSPITTGYRCDVALDGNGEICEQKLLLERPPTGGWDCIAARARDADHPFGQKLDVGNFAADVKLSDGCAVELEPHGRFPNPMGPLTALVAFDLANGSGLGMPLTIYDQGAGACGAATRLCTLDAAAFSPALTYCEARWGEAAPVVGLAPSDIPIGGPSLTDDELEMYFVRPKSLGAETAIYVTTRTSITAAWDPPHSVDELDGAVGDEAAPDISPDGLHIYFTSDRAMSGKFELFEAKRSSRHDPFSMPAPLVANITEAAPNSDHTRAIFAVITGGSDPDLVEFVRPDTTNNFMSAGPMMPPEINSPASELTPFLTADGLHLYFASDRIGGTGHNLYVSSRNAVDDPFGTPVLLEELSSAGNDLAPWVSSDNRRIYFTSDRTTVLPQIFMATR